MIRNCFNYVGSKDRIFPAIDKNLNKDKKYFVDLFCGSGVVGINEVNNYQEVSLCDACWQLAETLRYFKENEFSNIIRSIDNTVSKFELSKTNKEGYNKLRDFYNNISNTPDTFNPVLFYCLLTHSFNYNIHINSNGGFSVPFGANKSYLNSSLRNKLQVFQNELHKNKDKIKVIKTDFENCVYKISEGGTLQDTMFYCDPPYLSSDSAYGRIYYLGKWDAIKEKKLYSTLDFINENGGSFLLSNVIENNGKTNEILDKWAQKYTLIEVSSSFENCNYQRKNLGKTKEVLIRNY